MLTGHTGFKGAWLALWLQSLGATVYGLSSGVPTSPSLYELARIGDGMADEKMVDVRDHDAVARAVSSLTPEVVIHLAAQSLVRRSFANPRETFETNVMGTVNVLEAVRAAPSVRALVNVTSDKCYENRGWEWGYREDEPMGGHDPYSSSKGAAELVISAYRRSFFESGAQLDGDPHPRVASARAGNVIGGGDWGGDRLLPDLAQAALERRTVLIRNPDAIRPWQHVVSPLSGYLLLAQSLWSRADLAGAWNFGPPDEHARPVWWIVERIRERWAGRPEWTTDPGENPREAQYLKVDSSRAQLWLGWRPLVPIGVAIDSIVDWYESYAAGADMREITLEQIQHLAGVPAYTD
jgi:CDP-glucose 4,6-dehydratase